MTRAGSSVVQNLAPRVLMVEEAAELLRVVRTTAYDLIRSGALRSVKLRGRRLVPTAAIDELPTALGEEMH